MGACILRLPNIFCLPSAAAVAVAAATGADSTGGGRGTSEAGGGPLRDGTGGTVVDAMGALGASGDSGCGSSASSSPLTHSPVLTLRTTGNHGGASATGAALPSPASTLTVETGSKYAARRKGRGREGVRTAVDHNSSSSVLSGTKPRDWKAMAWTSTHPFVSVSGLPGGGGTRQGRATPSPQPSGNTLTNALHKRALRQTQLLRLQAGEGFPNLMCRRGKRG